MGVTAASRRAHKGTESHPFREGGRAIAPRLALASARVTLALSVLIFFPGLFEQFETPKTTVVRVVGLAWLAILATAGARSIRWSALDVAMVGWLPVEALATIFSQSPLLSVVGETQQHEGLLTTFGLVGIYFAVRFGTQGLDDRGLSSACVSARKSLDIVLGATAVACVYALLQAGGFDPIRWLRTAGYGPMTRPFGTMGHPNLLGVMSAACAAIAFTAALQEERWRWLYALATALYVATTVLTFSRGAWLGLVAGVAASAIFVCRGWRGVRSQRGLPRPQQRMLLGTASAFALALALVFILGGARGELLRSRFAELLRPRGGSAASRVEIWRASAAAWRARPWLGHGPDTFELVFPRYQTSSYWRYEWTGLPFHAHSLYLHTLATRGVVGFALGMGWLFAFAWTARRVWQRDGTERILVSGVVGGSCAVGVAGAFGAVGVSAWLFLVTAAAALAAAAVPGTVSARESERGAKSVGTVLPLQAKKTRTIRGTRRSAAPVRRIGWIVGGIATGAACLWSGTDLGASGAAAGARAALPHDAAMADAFAAQAARLRPFADWAHRLRSETLEAKAATMDTPVLHQAVTAARRAVEIEPERNLNHYRHAKTLLALAAHGDVDASHQAAASFRRCIEISPVDAVSMLELGRIELQSGSQASALELASRAASLYPDEGATQSLLAAALLHGGRGDEARRALERAVAGEWHGNDQALQTARDLLQSLP